MFEYYPIQWVAKPNGYADQHPSAQRLMFSARNTWGWTYCHDA